MAQRVDNSFPPTNPLLQSGQRRGPGGKWQVASTPAASSLAGCPGTQQRHSWPVVLERDVAGPSTLPPATARNKVKLSKRTIKAYNVSKSLTLKM